MFSWGPAPRRFAGWLAAAVLVALAVAPVAVAIVSVAVAQGPGGGYHDTYDDDKGRGADNGLAAIWSVARAPLRWLRQSSRSFQSLMRLLAERSAIQAGDEAPPPPWPKRPRKDPVEVADEPPRQSIYGGEAGAGPDGGVRVKEWHKRTSSKARPKDDGSWPTSCRRAGVPVRRGSWYVVQRGDTLWRIAEVHYGYGEAYLRLRRANAETLPDANRIYPCQRLYIPRWRCCGFRAVPDPPPEHDGAEGGEDGRP